MMEVEAVSVAPRMGVSCLALLVVAALVFVGVIGLVLLIVGLVKRRPALWISGIVVMVLAGLVLVVGAVGVAFIGSVAWRSVPVAVMPGEGPTSIAVPDQHMTESGNFVQNSGGRATARAEGVDFEVIQPGAGGARFLSSSSTSGGRSEARFEITMGETVIVVTKNVGHMHFSVNGRDYGPVHKGDSVVINAAREVTVNGRPRGPAL